MQFLNHMCILGLLCAGSVFALPSDGLYEEQKVEGIIDNLVNSTINKILANLTEPIEIGVMALDTDNKYVSGQANMSGFTMSGIKGMVATEIDVALLTMKMNATVVVPRLIVDFDYFSDLVFIELIPLYGNGKIEASIDDIVFSVSGKLNMTGGIRINDMEMEFTIGTTYFNLHGILNDEEFSALVSEVLNDIVQPLINDNKEVIGSLISSFAEDIINSILNPNTIDEILEEEMSF